MSEKQELPAVTVPAYLQSLPSGGSASGSITLSGGAVKYDSMYLGQGDTITVEGDVTLYVTGDIGLGNSSQVNISNTNPNASLTIYVGGGFSTKNGGMINNLTADPTKLQIYALDTLYGAIYAPNAEVSMKNSVEIYGSIVSNQFFQAAASNVYYDPALRNVASDGVNTSLIMQQWSEP
jgi:hypothetical protein